MDEIKTQVRYAIQIAYIMIVMEALAAKGKSEEEMSKALEECFNREAERLIATLGKSGYTISPTEKIPNAFNF